MEESPKRRGKRLSWRATEEEDTETMSKRSRFYRQLENEVYGGGEVEPAAATGNSVSPAGSRTDSGKHEAFSSDVVKRSSSDLENVGDLKPESLGTELAPAIDGVFSREATPTSELYGETEQILSPSKKKQPGITCRKIVESAPSAAELEEFFSAAEKYQQKVFAEKYNYDIVKDVPLEGKYEWVRLHH